MRMELPQSRPFGTEGKKPTHDFLSLYNHSSFQHQDPRPSQGNCLKTRDFLQPLETVGKNNSSSSEEESRAVDKSNTVERPAGPPTQPRPPSSSSSSSIEHILPGGIGTYTINHISDFNHLVPPKPERSPPTVVPACNSEKKVQVKNDMSNSNSSYSGSSFTLWGDSVVETGTTITKKSNTAIREPAENLGSWSSEQPLPPPPNYIIPTTFNSLPSSKETGQKNLSFMEMMKSGKSLHEEDDDEEEFPSKKDISSQKELRVKVDGKSNDQKANTPRSKHSATEQRRRSKINDRFQILRDLLPLNDQKRDKASFLLEVIEYIQFLQEKVNKYEGPYQGWNQEPTKLMPWRNRHGPGESIADHSRGIKNVPGPGLIFGGKSTDINVSIHPPILPNSAENDQKPGAIYKPDLRFSNKAIPATVPMQPDMFIPSGRSCDLTQPTERPISDGENLASKSESHLWQSRTCTTSGALNGQDERAIQGGTIRISNVYSQELLNNLTKALESSGVDLSLATISVQVDLGKQPVGSLTTTMDHTNPSKTMGRPRSGEDSDQAQKRLKTEKS